MAEYTYDILLDRLAALCSQKEKCEYDAFAYLQKKRCAICRLSKSRRFFGEK